MTDQREGTLDDLLDALQNYSMPNKVSSSESSKRDKQSNSASSSITKLAPSISLDKENLSSSPLKNGTSNAPTHKSMSKGVVGSSLDPQMKSRDKSVSGENPSKLRSSEGESKSGQSQDSRGPTMVENSNGRIQNDVSSPSIKLTGGSSSTTKTAPPPPPPRTSSTQPGASTDSVNNGGGHVSGMVRKMSSKINSMNNCGRESGGESSDFR